MKRPLLIVLLLGSIGLSIHTPGRSEGVMLGNKTWSDVIYEPTSIPIVEEMLEMAGVGPTDVVYDLGCGDGRIVIMAAQRGARGIGVDMDPARIRESVRNAEAEGVSQRVVFLEQDFFKTDIADATVVMLYLLPQVNLRLRPKLLRELRPGTRIVSHQYAMGDWKADSLRSVRGRDLHFFVVPANVTGTWRGIDPEGLQMTLSFTQKFQQVEGIMTIGPEAYPITNCSLKGENLSFTLERTAGGLKKMLFFWARIAGASLEARIIQEGGDAAGDPWKATRIPLTSVSIAE